MEVNVTTELDNQINFTCALVQRFLEAEGLDLNATTVVEGGLRVGRLREEKPPDPWQQPERYYPGLSAKPWHNPADFDWVLRLEAAFPAIRAEAIALHQADRFTTNPLSGDLAEGSWREFRLYSEGYRLGEHCAACPRTTEIVESIPGATSAGLVYFASVGPGTHLRAHWGPHNARLRCHLGLVIPDACSLRVADESRSWEEGRVMIFDDSFEHELWNPSGQTRIVLILDVWHPDLTPAQIIAIRYSDSRFVRQAYAVASAWLQTGDIPRLSPATADQ